MKHNAEAEWLQDLKNELADLEIARRGEDFCTHDQKSAKENAELEIPGSRWYAWLLVEKVYSVT